jgi:hypothetical protein
MFTDPFDNPLQVILYPPLTVGLDSELVSTVGCVNVIVFVVVQPFASVKVTEYVPATSDDGFWLLDV